MGEGSLSEEGPTADASTGDTAASDLRPRTIRIKVRRLPFFSCSSAAMPAVTAAAISAASGDGGGAEWRAGEE
jgi:hypothetical protein